MVTKRVPEKTSSQADAEKQLQEAQARLKGATDRHAALVAVLSRVGVSPQEKRDAQAQSKKIDHDLRDAKRLVQEAQAALTGKQ